MTPSTVPSFLPATMGAQFLGEMGIRQAVAVSHGEMLRAAEIFAHRLRDAAAGHVFLAGVGERDFPVEFQPRFVDLHFVGLELDGAVGVVQMKVAEVILHRVGLEAEAQHEAAEAVLARKFA